MLNDLIQSEDFKSRLSSLLPSERKALGELGASPRPSPKSSAAAAPTAGVKPPPPPRPLGREPARLPPHSPPPTKKLKPQAHRLSAGASLHRKQHLSSSAYWASDAGMSPLNLCRFPLNTASSLPTPTPPPSPCFVKPRVPALSCTQWRLLLGRNWNVLYWWPAFPPCKHHLSWFSWLAPSVLLLACPWQGMCAAFPLQSRPSPAPYSLRYPLEHSSPVGPEMLPGRSLAG